MEGQALTTTTTATSSQWYGSAQHDRPHLQLDNTVWWFCSTACRDEFATDPNKFANRAIERRAASAAGRP